MYGSSQFSAFGSASTRTARGQFWPRAAKNSCALHMPSAQAMKPTHLAAPHHFPSSFSPCLLFLLQGSSICCVNPNGPPRCEPKLHVSAKGHGSMGFPLLFAYFGWSTHVLPKPTVRQLRITLSVIHAEHNPNMRSAQWACCMIAGNELHMMYTL